MAIKPVKVSRLNKYINNILQSDPLLGNVSVIGEISNLKYHSSGHVYFSLKDESSKINCFLPSSKVDSIRYQLDEGMEVTILGKVNLYEAGGYCSLYVKDVIVEGMGSLSIAFEKLKEKLDKEGLFDPSSKKPIPSFPKTIAILTADTGAALQDILKIITGKNNYVDILIFPVTVQGPTSAPTICKALDLVNSQYSYVDTIILGRGGGSMEDLWPFNEETVARAIADSQIPIISAVGHETDFTISDFVADLRAETPTAAAHIAAPDIEGLVKSFTNTMEVLQRSALTKIEKCHGLGEGFHPDRILRQLEIKLEYNHLKAVSLMEKQENRISQHLTGLATMVKMAESKLNSLNPLNMMERGYCLVTDNEGRIIRNIDNIHLNQNIRISIKGGHAMATVTEVKGG